ncbi:hypothetical protein PCE1_000538 [Barthelona sp. PCE]
MSRFDSRTTAFSSTGHLNQVEYALSAITKSSPVISVKCTDGVIICCSRKIVSKLLNVESKYRTTMIDDHIMISFAGMVSDATDLINDARLTSQRHLYKFQTPILVESLVRSVADEKHSYTQFGGLRPYGVTFVYAGHDEARGFQLFTSDPSGNYKSWKATAFGKRDSTAIAQLREGYKEDMDLEAGLKLIMDVYSKVVDTTELKSEKIEIAVLTKNEYDQCVQRQLSTEEIDELLSVIVDEGEKAEANE